MSLTGGKSVTLPTGWSQASLGEIANVQLGKMLSPKAYDPGLQQLPYLRNENVRWGTVDLSDVKLMGFKPSELDRYAVKPLDLLVCEGGEAGRCAVYTGPPGVLLYQKALHRVRPYDGISPYYLRYWLEHAVRSGLVQPQVAETTIQHLPLERIQKLLVPLAPTSEQLRIVASIDKQLSRLDAAVSALDRARANLKRYRASVLKAACEGRLVPTEAELARAEGRDYETGEQLLARIQLERRELWQAQGPVRNGLRAYAEAASPDPRDLPELPEGWCWSRTDSLLNRIEAGNNFKCIERPPFDNEVGVVKISAVTWGTYNENESKTCPRPETVDQRMFIQEGDLLFSRANTIELVGASVIASRPTKRLMLSDKVLRLRTVACKEWLHMVLRSPWGRSEIETLATGNQNSMRNIGQDRIRRIRVPIPPFSEQQRILEEVDERLSVASKLEAESTSSLQRAERLRQAILKRAFEGKLVPQDPNDEPATELLERIRSAQVNGNVKTARSTRKGSRVGAKEMHQLSLDEAAPAAR